jgi:iron complex transport system ATP-binding protein
VEHAVSLEDVQVRIGGSRILGPVSVKVGRGEHWALLGPNGSGKTTLLSVAGAWRQPSSGSVWVLGERLGRVDVRTLRARIGHVGQTVSRALRPAQSVLDTVLTGRASTLEMWWQTVGPDDLDEANRRLAQVGCKSLADQTLGTCSQGERQRVLLARALFGRPELLLFDEPAAGLDLPGRETLLAAMSAVRDGTSPTTITATHHLEELPASTSHAALLRAGELVAAGPVDEVLTDAWLGETFGLPIRVTRDPQGRWSATAH